MGYYRMDLKDMNDWANDNSRKKGVTQINVKYLRLLNQIKYEFAQLATANYFGLVKLGIENCRVMMESSKKTSDFIFFIICQLKKYKLEGDWIKVFDRNIKRLNIRVEYLRKIFKENLKYTKYYPFFEENGYTFFTEFKTVYNDDNTTPLDYLICELDEYEKFNTQKINDYLESIKDEVEAYEKYHSNVIEKEKEEKKKKKERENEEKAFQKETEAIIKKQKSEIKKIDRQFARYTNPNTETYRYIQKEF